MPSIWQVLQIVTDFYLMATADVSSYEETPEHNQCVIEEH